MMTRISSEGIDKKFTNCRESQNNYGLAIFACFLQLSDQLIILVLLIFSIMDHLSFPYNFIIYLKFIEFPSI